MASPAAIHAQVRTDLTAELRALGTAVVQDVAVPACPAWTVKDVLAHVAGVADDILAGNLEGVATDPWTAAQVDKRRDRTLAEVLDELDELDPQVEAVADGFGPVAQQWLFDLMTHDWDVRGALELPADRAGDGLELALDFVAPGYHLAASAAGHPPLALRAGGATWAPDGDADASVDAGSPFELLRGLSGRRSEPQLAAWTWSVDPAPHLASFTFGPFVPRPDPLVE